MGKVNGEEERVSRRMRLEHVFYLSFCVLAHARCSVLISGISFILYFRLFCGGSLEVNSLFEVFYLHSLSKLVEFEWRANRRCRVKVFRFSHVLSFKYEAVELELRSSNVAFPFLYLQEHTRDIALGS